MPKGLSTGRNEVGMMSDLKGLAEEVGSEVLGFDIEWLIETTVQSTGKRPDVEIRRADGTRERLVAGEAKRPETLKGLHAYVQSEVEVCSAFYGTQRLLTVATWWSFGLTYSVIDAVRYTLVA